MPSTKKQVNPSIPKAAVARLDELAVQLGIEKYTVLNIALEYGLRNFAKAWSEYGEARLASVPDSSDERKHLAFAPISSVPVLERARSGSRR